jgi:HSP20 family protein
MALAIQLRFLICEGDLMNIVRWEPYREMEDMFRRYAPFFGRGLGNGKEVTWAPSADISETEQEFLIKADLPEVKKEDVKISLQNGVITLSGERKQEKRQKDENQIRVETFYGAFERSFALPDNADTAAIRAETKDGVLRIHIPKKEPAKAKSVQIEVK